MIWSAGPAGAGPVHPLDGRQDPAPLLAAPYPLRLLLLLATMAFHAFFGVTLMGSTTLIQPEWFAGLGRDWGLPAMEDQQVAGALTWGIGEIPTVLIAIGVAIKQGTESTVIETRSHKEISETVRAGILEPLRARSCPKSISPN
jgi:cytochrome c oxidase assembly factor CtaG